MPLKKDLSWIDDYIKSNDEMGRALTAQTLQRCKDLILDMEREMWALRNELRKWRRHKPRPAKKEASKP